MSSGNGRVHVAPGRVAPFDEEKNECGGAFLRSPSRWTTDTSGCRSTATRRLLPEYFRMAMFYDAYGLGSHPVVALLKREVIDTMMSSALARSQHLDRIAHYGAWLGNETVKVEDLTSPPPDGTEGRASGPRRGRSPFPRRRRRSRRPSGPLGNRPCPDLSPVGRASGRRAPAASLCERRVRATNRPCGRRPGRTPRRPPAVFQRRRESPLPSPP